MPPRRTMQRISQLFGKTLRDVPAEAETPSHQLLLRAGMIQQLAAGVYSYLPLGWKVLRKIEQIIREEMDAAGGQELSMPVLQPLEMWEETGRAGAFGENLFRLRDRRGRPLVLGPTHEEVIADLVRRNVQSYRDLPKRLYQIQTKFRDEPRPRGGLVRVREFTMKDLYSFDADEEGLEVSYRAMLQAYSSIFARCGLPAVVVEADSGAIGGKDSHEFVVLADTGENELVFCTRCDYAANVEKAEFAKEPGEQEGLLPVEEVSTPGAATIEEVGAYLGVPHKKTLKAVFYVADGEFAFVVIRGDLEVNEVKLRNALGANEVRLASDAEVEEAGVVAGAASPVGLSGLRVVGDNSIQMGANFVAGANKPETHLKNVNYPRDFRVDVLADIALAKEGHGCGRCGAPLRGSRGIEVGHCFKLGTTIGSKPGPIFLDQQGRQRPMVMGCYGIGTGRLLAAVMERNHDERGIVWPVSLAPFQVHLCALVPGDADVQRATEEAVSTLEAAALSVLLDDREESAGVKFNDADLLGMPVRVTVSPRTVKAGAFEVKGRRAKGAEMVEGERLVEAVRSLLEDS